MYKRRVSFNNVAPDYIDPTSPIHVPPQYTDPYDYLPNTFNTRRRRPSSLPQPPEKGILKPFEIVEHMAKAPRKEERRFTSSLAGLSDQEVLAMDKQYSHRSVNPESFEFSATGQVNGKEEDVRGKMDLTTFHNKYSTHPSMTHGSCCIRVMHSEFPFSESGNSYYAGVYLAVISGRRHTWSAIDFAIENLVNDGDILVISASLEMSQVHHTSSQPVLKNRLEEPIYEKSSHYSVHSSKVHEKCNEVMNYALARVQELRPGVKIAINMEMVSASSSKYAFLDCARLYMPHAIVIGTKSFQKQTTARRHSSTVTSLGDGLNGSYKLGGTTILKLSSFIMKHSNVPVILLNDGNAEMKKLLSGSPPPQSSIKFREPFQEPFQEPLQNENKVDIEDLSSISSESEETDGCFEGSRRRTISTADSAVSSEEDKKMDQFTRALVSISDKSLKEGCERAKSVEYKKDTDSDSHAQKNIQWGNPTPYKVKSLLDPSPPSDALYKSKSSISTDSYKAPSTRRTKSTSSEKKSGFLKKMLTKFKG